jgi:hypothetical protein
MSPSNSAGSGLVAALGRKCVNDATSDKTRMQATDFERDGERRRGADQPHIAESDARLGLCGPCRPRFDARSNGCGKRILLKPQSGRAFERPQHPARNTPPTTVLRRLPDRTLVERIKGGGRAAQGDAEALLMKATAIAEEIGALSWQLRAANELTRLWQSQSRTVDAKRLLQSIYDTFTEGFETRDLVITANLLAKLQ